jgi:uncharacterized Fe-S center protein
MKSKVYFIPVENSEDVPSTSEKLKTLLEKSGILRCVQRSDRTAVKVHFGEEGNFGFVKPEYIRMICDGIKAIGAKAFLSDTNTLYRGMRTNSADHRATAKKHGFTKSSAGIDIVIPDDSKKESAVEVPIGLKFIKSAKLARIFTEVDSIVAISHLKGHILSGFGGAIKNIAMGCATRAGKLAQHCDISPVVYVDKCIGCGACVKTCPAEAIGIRDKKSVIDRSKCIGCAGCVEACPTAAMFIDMRSGDAVQLKMAEYAFAVLKKQKIRSGFVNFAVKITQECDCWGGGSPVIAPDVGIFASSDPVAIDKAGFDIVNRFCKKDIFKLAHPEQDGRKQLEYARKLGLGNIDYELIRL